MVASRTSAAHASSVAGSEATRNRRPDVRRIASCTRRTLSSPVTATSVSPSTGPSQTLQRRCRSGAGDRPSCRRRAPTSRSAGRRRCGRPTARPRRRPRAPPGAAGRPARPPARRRGRPGTAPRAGAGQACPGPVVVEVGDETLPSRVGLDGRGDRQHLGVFEREAGVVGQRAERRRLGERRREPLPGGDDRPIGGGEDRRRRRRRPGAGRRHARSGRRHGPTTRGTPGPARHRPLTEPPLQSSTLRTCGGRPRRCCRPGSRTNAPK